MEPAKAFSEPYVYFFYLPVTRSAQTKVLPQKKRLDSFLATWPHLSLIVMVGNYERQKYPKRFINIKMVYSRQA